MNANAVVVDATDDNESVNKNTGQDANPNNGSNTPSTTAKQKKPFFKKNVILNNKSLFF